MTPFGPMSLGELIAALEAVPSPGFGVEEMTDREVKFAFGGLLPGRLTSYRGFYDHLALTFETWDERHKRLGYACPPPMKSDLLRTLKDALGPDLLFSGWKGGDYRMTEKTPIWVALPGECPGTGIVGVSCPNAWLCLILTEHIE